MIRTWKQRVCRGYHPCSCFGGLWVSDFVLHERARHDRNWRRAKQRCAGGQQSTYMTSATPEGVISFYKQLLPAAGWTVTDTNSDDESGKEGANLQAINGRQYLALNAIRPTGKTYVKVCIWPSKPSNDRCD